MGICEKGISLNDVLGAESSAWLVRNDMYNCKFNLSVIINTDQVNAYSFE